MVTIDHKINIKTLAALKRVYSTQLELYKYILSHEVPFEDAEDTFMRRTLSDLANASEKILTHINLNTYHGAMYMYVRSALSSVQNSLSVFDRLLQLVGVDDCNLSLDSSDKITAYLGKLEDAIKVANRAVDILKIRLEEGC